ncbi:PLP-dependent aminotransferase family protein [uncultured Sphingomonas sp.]|uniref:aminotransferase-like domain-containing protein n=1 Tax=uncultured Sphingomonas sp. TaxID=158754 RepID=UPI00262D6107|nr:PLP-dependent aminotransferase family protein [uncultured Sphingomonas sp.]
MSLAHPDDHDSSNMTRAAADAPADMTIMERIYRGVVEEIDAGVLLPGQRLPSVRTMSARHRVSRDTIVRAYDKLIANGQAYAVRGAGFYVREATPADRPITTPAVLPPLDPSRLIHSDHPLDRTPGSGILRHEESAQAEVAKVARAVTAAIGSDGTYGNPLGYLPLRQALCDKLKGEGIEVPLDQLVTTPGAVAGLSLVIRALLRPGTSVLYERPCSFIHLQVLMAQGASGIGVPRQADGPDLEALRTLCERHRPYLFLLSSVLHNPTGTSIAPHKVHKLLEIAAEFDLLLVDDASYADLLPTGPGTYAAAPLMRFGGLRRVIHVGGFSHTIAPAVAPGFVVADESRMQFIRYFRPIQGLGNTIIQERLLYRFLHEGLYRRRCDRVRAHLARCSMGLRRTITDIGLPFAVPPAGGLFLWGSLGDGIDATEVATRMLARTYLTAPAVHFTRYADLRSYMRFNVTTTNANTLAALANCL